MYMFAKISKVQITIVAWVYSWVLYSIPLDYMSVLGPSTILPKCFGSDHRRVAIHYDIMLKVYLILFLDPYLNSVINARNSSSLVENGILRLEPQS
jgi:hypothetical protein